jgi:hypothetical protein
VTDEFLVRQLGQASADLQAALLQLEKTREAAAEQRHQLNARIGAEESARARSETLLQQTGLRLSRLQTAASIACRAWENTKNHSIHEIRLVMRELRAIIGEPTSVANRDLVLLDELADELDSEDYGKHCDALRRLLRALKQ